MNSFLECTFHWFKALNCKLKPSTSFYPYRSQENSPTDGRRKILYAALPEFRRKVRILFESYDSLLCIHSLRKK